MKLKAKLNTKPYQNNLNDCTLHNYLIRKMYHVYMLQANTVLPKL